MRCRTRRQVRTLSRRSSASLARSRALCHLMTSFSDMVPTSSSLSASLGLLDTAIMISTCNLTLEFTLMSRTLCTLP